MRTALSEERIETAVIGGGQAGLAMGRQLQRLHLNHVILDENTEVGAAWRNRWDSLRLFTPARYSGLPDMPFPGRPGSHPTKDDMADYLADYAAHFELPVRNAVGVGRVRSEGDGFVVETTGAAGGRELRAENVVVATGGFHRPRIPDLAADLDPAVIQLHSRDYRRPAQVPPGDVLVVGKGSSGAEIALELAKDRRVVISGRDPGQEPTVPGSVPDRFVTPVMWFMATRVLKVTNPLGRKVRDQFLHPPRGIPRGGWARRKDLEARGVDWVGRTTGTRGGLPVIEDGRVLDVASVIWCTGFAPDFSWVDDLEVDEFGFPVHDSGIAVSLPGMHFLGLLFQRALASSLVGGVGRDAAHLARHIRDRVGAPDMELQGAT